MCKEAASHCGRGRCAVGASFDTEWWERTLDDMLMEERGRAGCKRLDEEMKRGEARRCCATAKGRSFVRRRDWFAGAVVEYMITIVNKVRPSCAPSHW